MPALQYDFTEAELRALYERVRPYPRLGLIRLGCELALLGRASIDQCTRLQAAVNAMRASAGSTTCQSQPPTATNS